MLNIEDNIHRKASAGGSENITYVYEGCAKELCQTSHKHGLEIFTTKTGKAGKGRACNRIHKQNVKYEINNK